jgi:hypothetical protein
MFRRIVFNVSFCLFVFIIAKGVMAFGMGGYMTIGGGNTSYGYNKYEYFATGKLKESENWAVGGGLIMDSNLASDRVFNWRMHLSGERLTADREAEMKLVRLRMNHVFGFGIVRTKRVRLWLGPQIGINYSWGDRTKERYYYGIGPLGMKWQLAFLPAGLLSPNNFGYGIFRDKISIIRYGGIDLGLALGLNINLGDYVTIGPEVGFKYALNFGFQNRKVYGGFPVFIEAFVPINDNKTETLTVKGYEIYGNIAVIFRVGGDNYRSQ